MFHIRLLGELQVECPRGVLGIRDFGGVKTRRIFEILVLNRGHAVAKDRLADLLWDGRPPADHIATLESYVSILRGRLEPAVARSSSVIVTGTGSYTLDATRTTLDVDEFQVLAQQGFATGGESAFGALASALRLVRGSLLADEPYAAWAEPARERFRNRLATVTVRAARLSLELGEIDRAAQLARDAQQLDPFSEPACKVAMQALWSLGERAEALRFYEALRRRLRDDLALDPGDDLQAEFTMMLRADQSAGSVRSPELASLVGAVIELYRRVNGTTSRALPPVGDAPPWTVGPERLLGELLARAADTSHGLAVAR